MVLRVDLGDHQRQLVAGLAREYTLQELEGRHVLVVVNLQPAVLRGEKSEGMLLAAHQIVASPRGVTLDGALLDCVRLEVDREAFGKVK